jgi:transcriptional regulator with XRE-family HTH domain
MMSGVGKEVRRLREAKGWSQAKLAVETGMAVSGISQIENDRRNPNSATLTKLARALEVEVADLFPLGQPRLPELVPPGQAYFVPLEEGEEEDTVTLEIHYVRLFENGEEVVRAMRPATSQEEREMRQRIQKAGHSRE